MILGFVEFLDTKKQKPTHFREKIWAGPGKSSFDCNGTRMVCDLKAANAESEFRTGEPLVKLLKPKLHTIREDVHDRWKPGMSIQMVYRGTGYKIKDEFNKGIPELSKCVSVQKIEIKWSKDKSEIEKISNMRRLKHRYVEVFIDNNLYFSATFNEMGAGHTFNGAKHWSETECLLFNNDGFEDFFDFFAWFKKDFKGKIIHWTDLRY